jgi:hypothetical protein
MSDTIALRNLLLIVLLVLLLAFLVSRREQLSHFMQTVRPVPWALLSWFAFLLCFPLWAVQSDVAWVNLRGQWIESIVAWIIGFGAAWILGSKGPGLWALALASAFPLVVHLLLALLAWTGLLGIPIPAYFSFSLLWSAFANVFDPAFPSSSSWQRFPWGFHGVESMHGNLGYAACQAIALLSVCFLFSWRKQERIKVAAAFLAIAVCLISILVASSRGAVLFAILVMLLAGLVYFFKINSKQRHPAPEHQTTRWVSVLVLLVMSFLVFLVARDSVSIDQRWHSMVDKVIIGLTQENPRQLLCNGLSPEVEKKIREDYKHRELGYVQDLIDGLKTQDGGRILLMRAGLDLVLENPRGLDGSRKSYEKLIEKKCGHVPQLRFEHTHQSWMDISLALGWVGAIIFAWALIFFMKTGWRSIDSKSLAPWAFALFLICGFWIIRGFVDSLYREHYLQMQAILIAYLFGRLISEASDEEEEPADI